MADELALDRLVDGRGRGILAALKSDGRPQLSTIAFCYDPDPKVVRISTTDGSAKVANLRRDPRASLYVGTPDLASYVVAEGVAEISPVARDNDDATVDELVEVYRQIAGEHPDWDDYRAAMVRDRRVVVRLRVERSYGLVR